MSNAYEIKSGQSGKYIGKDKKWHQGHFKIDKEQIFNFKKTDISKGGFFFIRSYLGAKGYEFDLKLPDRAKKIVSKYNNSTEYVFSHNKDYKYYDQFRRRVRRNLVKLQQLLFIDIEPKGGNLGIKVARHTFANRGKRLYIEEDLLRELMGHERADIDNYYKDKYPEEVRDTAQLQIISFS